MPGYNPSRLINPVMPPANVTTNQASGAGLVEASSLGLAVPSDAEHKSQVASVESNSDALTTSNNISGFISITRPAFSSQQAASGPLNIATATAGVLFSNNTRESIDSDQEIAIAIPLSRFHAAAPRAGSKFNS